ncbi:MAG TPA: branched-chain amino acid ABC transporter substrate-binding protein [Actinomycetota bacterium]|nr:branched-chain amino acid ABC transporter substrate-binding protein [Actinomycetota bacterium]
MQHRRWVTPIAVIGVLAMVAAACSKSSSTTSAASGGAVDCTTVQFGCVDVPAGAPIQIGTLLSVSGDNANLGQDSLYGVQLALDYLDKTFDGKNGQIDGHDVQLQNEDDKCSSEGGQAGSTKLAANTQIVAVIGTSCSGAALGVADATLGDKGIVLFSPSNTNPALTAPGTHNPFYFRTAHNDAIQGAVVVDFATQQLSAKTAATIHDETPYTEGLTTVFGQDFTAAGGTITDAEAINSADSDFKPVLTKIAQNAPDVIYMPDYTAQCALLLQQAKQIPQLANTTMIGSDGCFSSDFIKLAGSAINGSYFSSPDLSAFSNADFYKNDFLPAYQKLAGSAPLSAFHAHAFDAVNILVQAIESVAIKNSDGSLSIPRSALRDAIQNTTDFPGIVTNYTCSSTGDCATTVVIGVYKSPNLPIEGGKGDGKPVFSETKTLASALGTSSS